MRVGVISDTHGLLRPEVVERLLGCDRIIHAGDVGKEAVLDALRRIAPTLAVRGNVDRDEWAEQLPESMAVCWNGVTIHVVHDLHDLASESSTSGWRMVISGHSHKALLEELNGVTYLNPGSVGPRRFRLPVTMAWLHLANGVRPEVEMVVISA